jgi:hypothetical protein
VLVVLDPRLDGENTNDASLSASSSDSGSPRSAAVIGAGDVHAAAASVVGERGNAPSRGDKGGRTAMLEGGRDAVLDTEDDGGGGHPYPPCQCDGGSASGNAPR